MKLIGNKPGSQMSEFRRHHSTGRGAFDNPMPSGREDTMSTSQMSI